MRAVQAKVAPCLAVLLMTAMLLYSGMASSALLGVSSFLYSPRSTLYALAQLQTQGDQSTTADPTPTATPIPAYVKETLTPSDGATSNDDDDTANDTPTPTAAPDPTLLLGAIDLIPDTGAPEGTGTVIEQYYPNGTGNTYIALEAGTLRNMTSVDNTEVETAIAQDLPFDIVLDSDVPQVLIMHTHATETYRLYEGLYYDLDDTARTTDKTLSVCAVGAIMAQTLNDAGIYTLHDTTLNDYPSYNDSYDNSYDVVAAYLEAYPSIKVVIDVHRDALQDDENWYAPVSEINGQQSAQVMIIAGCDNGSSITLPNCMENLAFAAAWQAEMEGLYPGLTRSAMFNYKYYNQDLTTGSLLLEVGGHGNTLNEALYAGQLAAESLVSLFTS